MTASGRHRGLAGALSAAVLWFATAAGAAQPVTSPDPDVERIVVASAPAPNAASTALVGYLSKPDGPGPFPAVLLLHGCGGIRGNIAHWRGFLTRMGLVTLALDSLTPRGVTEICTSPRISQRTRALDAYGGLDYLAALPFVRTDRIVVMGFSHGAGIALDVVSGRRLHLRDAGSARFHAAIALYPSCGSPRRMNDDYRAPALILSGAADDWSPAEACRLLANRHPDQVSLKIYPGALHAFDVIGRPRTFLPRVLNKNSPTGKGATVGGNRTALDAAEIDIETFVNTRVKP